MSTPQVAAPPSTSPAPKAAKPQKPKEEKSAKSKDQKPKDEGKPPAATAEGGDLKLTGKQLKEQKKAEKQARRAADKTKSGPPSAGKPEGGAAEKKPKQQQGQKGGGAQKKGERAEKGDKGAAVSSAGSATAAQPPREEVALFRHLENPAERQVSPAAAHKDVHPAILALGLQLASYTICGSSARCVATLLAFKRASGGITSC